MELHPIGAYQLTLLEAGQFIKGQLADIRALGGPELFTNEGLEDYLSELDTRVEAFNDALMPVRKNKETIKIEAQDNERDQALSALKKTAANFAISDIEEERDAARNLKTLFSTYKDLARLNYGTESLGIDNLLDDLGNSEYAPMVALLGLGRNVSRLEESNSEFKRLYAGRNLGSVQKETFDTKLLRNELLTVYADFAAYVLAMAKLKRSPAPFSDVLNVMNLSRKHFAGLLARRKGVAAEAV